MASGAPNRPLTEAVAPGESFETTLLFDVPRESEGLVLDLADGQLLNRVAEFFLIGDDDSFLFPRPVFSLRP